MRIVYEKEEIEIENIPQKIRVFDLLSSIKTTLNIEKSKNLILFEVNPKMRNSFTLKDYQSEIDSTEPQKYQYILLPILSKKMPIITNEEPIESLIMKVTGAQKQISIKKSKKHFPDDNLSFDFIERINERINNAEEQIGLNSGSRLNFLSQLFGESRQIRSLLNNPFTSSSSMSNNLEFRMNQVRNRLPVEPDQSLINNLVEMGFEEDRARRALISSKNNINHATEMLLNGFDADGENVNSNPQVLNVQNSENENLNLLVNEGEINENSNPNEINRIDQNQESIDDANAEEGQDMDIEESQLDNGIYDDADDGYNEDYY